MPPAPGSDHQWTDRLSVALLAILGIWLCASLYFVNLEFDDGYMTIVNGLYFAGATDFYAWARGPLMGLVLAPSAWLARLVDVHPMDVRPYHAITVALHWLYLVCVWKMLAANFGRNRDTLIAFVAAVPTLLFFSYAPFISHDILPGAILLGMAILADRQMRAAPQARGWLALVALGVMAACIKHTYALFWVALLAANALVAPADGPPAAERGRRLLLLAAAAVVSGAITWWVYAAVLGSQFPEVAFLHRPLVQASIVSQHFAETENARSVFYQGVYFRNLHAYGLLATCLALPGLYFSLVAPSRLARTIALAWIMLLVAILLIPMKEVRYLGFLAPLTAAVMIAAITRLTRIRRSYYAALAAVLLLDLALASREALRIVHPYYREQVTGFLRALPTEPGRVRSVIFPGALSFVSPEPAFFGDRYHRITHLLSVHLRVLYGFPASAVPLRVDEQRLRATGLSPGDFLVLANQIAVREPPIPADNRTRLTADFVQVLAEVELLALERSGDDYVETDDAGAIAPRSTLLLPSDRGSGAPTIGAGRFPVADILRLTGSHDAPDRITVTGARIHALCRIDGCQSL